MSNDALSGSQFGRYTTVSAHFDAKSKTVDEHGNPYKVKKVTHDVWEDAAEHGATHNPETVHTMLPNLPTKVRETFDKKKGLEYQRGHSWHNNTPSATYLDITRGSRYRDSD